MNILLVLPAADHLRVTCEQPNVPKRAMLRFSLLGLTTVAALTPPRHRVTICDENVEPLDLDAAVDVVGVSFMTALAPRAYQIAGEFRRRGKLVVAGGYHPTLCSAEVVEHFDAVVAGEAEGVWPELLDDLERGRLRRIYRSAGPADLATTPIPRRDILDRTGRYYVTTNAVQTGRGCNHGCRYCSIAAFSGNRFRNRPVEHVMKELGQVPRNFMFIDDNIIADPEYARRLFAAMIPLRKRWIAQCAITIADDPGLLSLARQAGCRGLFIGIETLSAKNLTDMGKDFNQAGSYPRRIAAIRKSGIGVQAGIMVGLDGDDVTVFERTLRFLAQARITALQLNIVTPLPGTPLHEEFDRAGRIVSKDWRLYDFRHAVIRPARMTNQQLQDGADWLYRQFYRLDRILLRALRDLVAIGPISAWLGMRLGLTYRYDNRREGIRGRDPAGRPWRAALKAWWRTAARVLWGRRQQA